MPHHLHPKSEHPQATRACEYSSFCCRLKRPVRYDDSPFPASAVAKGITHQTLLSPHAAGCMRTPAAKSCANRDAPRPYWKPGAEGIFPSGHLQFSSHGGTQTVKCSLQLVRRKSKRKHLHFERESANLPLGADTLKLDIVRLTGLSTTMYTVRCTNVK